MKDHEDAIVEDTMGSPKDIYVGGPAAVCAAAMQAKFGDGANVLYFHDGQRGLSNWKGSASYFHVRDAVPVYYWPDNHGAYCIYITAKHALQRRIDPEGYMKEITESGDWNKLRLRYSQYLSRDFLRISRIFAKNQWRALKDVGFNTGNGFATDQVKKVTGL